jgi:hypothetical protein
VSAEAQLVAQSWGEVDEVLSRPAGQTIQALHLACHGMLQEGGEDASLIIAANERLGLQELLRSDLRAPIVYMSACLVGRTREDADGDPLGLVSAFFLRGARTVIAALTPLMTSSPRCWRTCFTAPCTGSINRDKCWTGRLPWRRPRSSCAAGAGIQNTCKAKRPGRASRR